MSHAQTIRGGYIRRLTAEIAFAYSFELAESIIQLVNHGNVLLSRE